MTDKSENNNMKSADESSTKNTVLETGPDEPRHGVSTEEGGRQPFSFKNFKNLKTFSSLKNSFFRLFFIASLAQMAAMNMQMFSRSLLVFQLSQSATLLGLMGVAFGGPMLLVSLYGGAIADRIEKKFILIGGYAGAGILSLVIAVALATGYVTADNSASWWVLFAASAGQGAINGIMMPARQAIIPEIVGEEQLLNAISLRTFGMNFTRLVMPAVAGFLISLFNYAFVFYAMAAMYVVGIFFLLWMPRTGVSSIEEGGAVLQIKEGIKYLRSNMTVLFVLGYILFVVMLSMPFIRLLPMWEPILHIDTAKLGLLMSFSGFGALAGSLVMASLPNKKRGLLMLGGGVLSGLALIGFSFSDFWFPTNAFFMAIVFIFFIGIGQTVRMSLGNTLVQYYSEPQYRGRMMSFFLMNIGLTQLATVFIGMAVDKIGGEWAIGLMAIGLLVFSVGALVFIPRLRKLD